MASQNADQLHQLEFPSSHESILSVVSLWKSNPRLAGPAIDAKNG
jgi:hypothetical protein